MSARSDWNLDRVPSGQSMPPWIVDFVLLGVRAGAIDEQAATEWLILVRDFAQQETAIAELERAPVATPKRRLPWRR